MQENAAQKATVMDIECCICGTHQGTKDGQGQTGTTSTYCIPCIDRHHPELAAEFHRRRTDSGAAARGMVPSHKEPLNGETIFKEV